MRKILGNGTRPCAGRDGSTFEQILHIFIVVVIQTTHRDALAVALQFASHPAVLTTIVNLHRKTAVGPKLTLSAKPVGHWPPHRHERQLRLHYLDLRHD